MNKVVKCKRSTFLAFIQDDYKLNNDPKGLEHKYPVAMNYENHTLCT